MSVKLSVLLKKAQDSGSLADKQEFILAFIEKAYPRIVALAASFFPTAIDDALGDAALKLLELDLYKIRGTTEGEIYNYLETTVLRELIALKRKNKYPCFQQLPDENDKGSPAYAIFNATKQEPSIDLKAYINTLTAEQREVMELLLKELTQGEIAYLLDVSKSAVKNRIHRAKKQLKNNIGKAR